VGLRSSLASVCIHTSLLCLTVMAFESLASPPPLKKAEGIWKNKCNTNVAAMVEGVSVFCSPLSACIYISFVLYRQGI